MLAVAAVTADPVVDYGNCEEDTSDVLGQTGVKAPAFWNWPFLKKIKISQIFMQNLETKCNKHLY